MRVMMEEVPEGEWLCEECENELEYEKKKKLEKSQLKVGASKSQFFERKTNKIANASKSKSYEDETSKALEGKISKPDTALKNRSSFENEVENENGDKKELNSTNQCNNSNSKRKEEGAGIISSIKQSITERCGLSMGAESRKRLPLSRESSFRLDVEKGKQAATKVPTSLAFDAAKNLGPPLRGKFFSLLLSIQTLYLCKMFKLCYHGLVAFPADLGKENLHRKVCCRSIFQIHFFQQLKGPQGETASE